MGRKIKKIATEGEKVIDFIEEYCLYPEGKLVGRKVQLTAWQKDIVLSIYDNDAVTRRGILSFGRKNAKTSLAAFLLLAHLCGPRHRLNGQLYSTAQSRDQAALVFRYAAKMVRMHPKLRKVIAIRDTAKELYCEQLGTSYRALSAEVTTAYGLNPTFVVHDELGQVRGPRSALFDALETATGAQEDPLSVIISTQAPNDGDLLSILIDDALAENDPRVVLKLYTAPMEYDPFERETIAMANPALGDFLNEREVMSMAEDARRMPARESEFRNLILNQRIAANDPFITPTTWKNCGNPPRDIVGVPVYAGLDLSTVADLTALVLVGNVAGVWQAHCRFWLPGKDIRERARKDRVQYDEWAKQGLLVATKGSTVEYEYVAGELATLFQKYNIKKLAFDRWNMRNLVPWLIKAGFTELFIKDHFVEFGQGYQSMSPALNTLESWILNARLAHGNHPVLTMCAANSVVHRDPANNRKLDKLRSNGRIDGMVALAMAAGIAEGTVVEQPKEYRMLIL